MPRICSPGCHPRTLSHCLVCGRGTRVQGGQVPNSTPWGTKAPRVNQVAITQRTLVLAVAMVTIGV